MTSVACATLLFPSTSTSTSASNLIGRSPLPAWTRNRRNRRNRRKESTSTSVAAAAEQANTNSCHALFGKVVRERKRKRENTRASEQAREYKVATWLVAVLHLHFSSSALQLCSIRVCASTVFVRTRRRRRLRRSLHTNPRTQLSVPIIHSLSCHQQKHQQHPSQAKAFYNRPPVNTLCSLQIPQQTINRQPWPTSPRSDRTSTRSLRLASTSRSIWVSPILSTCLTLI